MRDIFSFFEAPKASAFHPQTSLVTLARGAGVQIEAREGGLAIELAPPAADLAWSFGEVKSADDLRSQVIFGPIHDYECACGKYKRMKHRGMVCEQCGVEVIQSKARRERLGHVPLRAPVTPSGARLPWTVAPLLPPDLRPPGMDAIYARLFDGSDPQRVVDDLVRASLEAAAQALRAPVRTDYSGRARVIVGETARAPLVLLRGLTAPLLYGVAEHLGHVTTIKSAKKLTATNDDLVRDFLARVLPGRVFLLSGPRSELVATTFEVSDALAIELPRALAGKLGVRTGDFVSVHFPISDAGQHAAKNLRARSQPLSGAPSWIHRVRGAADPVATLMEVAREGSVDPCEAPLAAMFRGGYPSSEDAPPIPIDLTPTPKEEKPMSENALLDRSVDELELSVRTANCLQNANIRTLRELVTRTEADMLKLANFGRKSLLELKEILGDMGLSFGMKPDAAPPKTDDGEGGI